MHWTESRGARLGAELIVILVGVLLALGVDAAWDGRQDERRAEAYLDQLRTEVGVTRADVEQAVRREGRVAHYSDAVFRGVYEKPRPPSDSLTTWLSRMFTSSSFVPTTSTVEALVATGDLQLVESGELRTEIVRYKQASEQLVRTFGIQDELLIETVQRVGMRVSLPRLFSDDDPMLGARPIADWALLSADEAFLSELFHVQSAARNRMRALETFRQRLEALQSVLE